MHRFRSFSRFSSTAFAAALLLLAMLSAQWTGLQHRVVHGGLMNGAVALIDSADDSAVDTAADLSHSCSLFDAAALGVTLHSTFFAVPCMRMPTWPMAADAILSWRARFVGHFSSRAPPLF